jgi:hypothetical protein
MKKVSQNKQVKDFISKIPTDGNSDSYYTNLKPNDTIPSIFGCRLIKKKIKAQIGYDGNINSKIMNIKKERIIIEGLKEDGSDTLHIPTVFFDVVYGTSILNTTYKFCIQLEGWDIKNKNCGHCKYAVIEYRLFYNGSSYNGDF